RPLAFGVGRPTNEDLLAAGGTAEAADRQRPTDLKGVRGLDALLPPFERDGSRALVALGEAAVDERDGQLVLPRRRVETDLAEPAVDLLDGRLQQLIDGLVVRFAADVRTVELLAVQEGDDGVLELHSRHFPG